MRSGGKLQHRRCLQSSKQALLQLIARQPARLGNCRQNCSESANAQRVVHWDSDVMLRRRFTGQPHMAACLPCGQVTQLDLKRELISHRSSHAVASFSFLRSQQLVSDKVQTYDFGRCAFVEVAMDTEARVLFITNFQTPKPRTSAP